MEFTSPKTNPLNNILIRILSFCVLVIIARFSYVITIRGSTCDSAGNFCFFPETLRFSPPSSPVLPSSTGISTQTDDRFRDYYSTVFQDLINEGFLSADSKTLCIGTLDGQDVAALRDIGVTDSIGISKKPFPPLVKKGNSYRHPFDADRFDIEFSGISGLDRANKPAEFASEVSRTLKPGGFFVVHTVSKDQYSLNSLQQLFNSCRFVRSRIINGIDSSSMPIREIVFRKESINIANHDKDLIDNGSSGINCHVPEYKRELIRNAESFIEQEPEKPWIELKRNLKNVKPLPSMVDISFKNRYVYIDVGGRSYGSSIGSWFGKIYPKQKKTFEIYAIEADKAFHEEYKNGKRVTFIPLVAWLRNETLFFEIKREANRRKSKEKGRGMGRIQSVESSSDYVGEYDKIKGFDFASWLKSRVTVKDYVVMKMDVEGREFELIPRLVETGGICLIDEMFLECHYNRWQRCCPGVRTPKFHNTFRHCLDLFHYLRDTGLFVHQWWS